MRSQTHDLEEWGEEATLYLKRLRERCRDRGTNFRYLIVPERHKSGAIHCHALIHHVDGVTERMVRGAWKAGFNWAKEVPNSFDDQRKLAGYVTKYVTKDLMIGDGAGRKPRIRASQKYGEPVVIRDAELVNELKGKEGNVQELWRQNLAMMIRQLKAEKEGPTSPYGKMRAALG